MWVIYTKICISVGKRSGFTVGGPDEAEACTYPVTMRDKGPVPSAAEAQWTCCLHQCKFSRNNEQLLELFIMEPRAAISQSAQWWPS